MKTVSILFIISYSSLCFSQLDTSFLPLKKDLKKSKELFKESEKVLNAELKGYQGNFKDDFKRIQQNQRSQIKTLYNDIYFNTNYENYLERITKEIIGSNPTLASENLRIYFIYNHIPNACNTGEGSIFINLGLLEILENESELAYIIGHEIGHQSQRHVRRSVDELFDNFYSEEYQHKVEEMKKMGLGRYNRFKELVKNLELDNSRHSRSYETESDSLAYEYIRNTRYNVKIASEALLKLKQADTELIDMNQVLTNTFHFDDFPFNPLWIKKKASIGDKYKQELSKQTRDSLSTHPNTVARYEFIQNLIQSSPQEEREKFEISRDTFALMKKEFNYISIQKLIESKDISKAMYQIFKSFYRGDEDPFLKIKLLQCMETVVMRLNDHTLGDYVDNRNPYYADEYNKLLIFIDNLTLKDAENLVQNYKLKLNSN